MTNLEFNPASHPELSYEDVFLLPYNSLDEKLKFVATNKERRTLNILFKKTQSGNYDAEDNYGNNQEYFAYRDCLAAKYDNQLGLVGSRDEIDFRASDKTTPIVIANMNTVVGPRMAETAALIGVQAALPQDYPNPEEFVKHQQSRHPEYQTPVILDISATIGELREELDKYDFETAILVERNKFHSTVSWKDIPQKYRKDLGKGIATYASSNPLIGWEDTTPSEALEAMHEEGEEILPILDDRDNVIGCISKKLAALRILGYEPYKSLDGNGLGSLVTVGVNNGVLAKVEQLIKLRVNGIVIDTAHFDRNYANNNLIRQIRSLIYESRENIQLIVGNVATQEGTRAALSSGADVVKVGIGPGAACSTRRETGAGRPQFSAILECANAAVDLGGQIWADGGIKNPRDLALAIAAGAEKGMMGTSLLPTWESAAPLQRDKKGRAFKIHSGMAHYEAAKNRNGNGVKKSIEQIARETIGMRSEGAQERIYLPDKILSVMDIVRQYIDGLTSACSYSGASNLEEFRYFSHIGIQTPSGNAEGFPQI
ncbi:IMP dehydrogenase [Candidatus Gracilibacteria bacterium]|nr:IMP dehydrogenase [Candidatus Gracilibacteria bacterium]